MNKQTVIEISIPHSHRYYETIDTQLHRIIKKHDLQCASWDIDYDEDVAFYLGKQDIHEGKS